MKLNISYRKAQENDTQLIAFFKGTAGEYLKLGPMAYTIISLAATTRNFYFKGTKLTVNHL